MTESRRNVRARERYASDPEHRARELARAQAYRSEHPDVAIERQRRWRERNPEKNREAYRRQNAKRRLDPEVREDARRRAHEWKEKNPDRVRARRLLTYGLTQDDYAAMLEQQGGLCAICRQPERRRLANGRQPLLAVDHDHKSGQVRALLCQRCNQLIGAAEDSPSLLLAMARYLERFA